MVLTKRQIKSNIFLIVFCYWVSNNYHKDKDKKTKKQINERLFLIY